MAFTPSGGAEPVWETSYYGGLKKVQTNGIIYVRAETYTGKFVEAVYSSSTV